MSGRIPVPIPHRPRKMQNATTKNGFKLWNLLVMQRYHICGPSHFFQSLISNKCLHPNFAFWHLPPNSARNGHATEGAIFVSTQLSTDAVSTLQNVWALVRLDTTLHQSTHANMRQRKEFCLDSSNFGYICPGISNVGSYKRKCQI